MKNNFFTNLFKIKGSKNFPLLPLIGAIYLFYLSKITFLFLNLVGLVSILLFAFLEVSSAYAIVERKIYWKERKELLFQMNLYLVLFAFALIVIWSFFYLYVIYSLFITKDIYAQVLSAVMILIPVYIFSLLLFFEIIKPLKLKGEKNG